MNDKQQIEEMANILCESKEHNCSGEDCRCLKQATDLFNNGARILPENAVVLTWELYNEMIDDVKVSKEKLARIIDSAKAKTSKETVREILDKVDKESNGQTIQITNLLRKQYGVEVNV